MSKRSGIGQLLLVGGYDLSGDTGSLSSIHGGPAPLVTTGLDKAGFERIGGLLNGGIAFEGFFNDAAGHAHPVLGALPTGDIVVLHCTGSTLGMPAAGLIARQPDYSLTRGADGSLKSSVPTMADGFGLEWGDLLTAGKRTDTAATNGTGVDGAAASTTGWSAFLEVTAFTGTDVTVAIEDSADNASFAAVTGGTFTQVTAAPAAQRIAGAAGATLRRYVRAVTTTSGGVTSVTFAVAICRHPTGAAA